MKPATFATLHPAQRRLLASFRTIRAVAPQSVRDDVRAVARGNGAAAKRALRRLPPARCEALLAGARMHA